MTVGTAARVPADSAVALPGSGNRPLVLVQVLRAFAATLVLVGHTNSEVARMATESGARASPVPHIPSGFGVDLFFAISGFIMIMSSQRLFAAPNASRIFLWRRVIRLVPLYWLVTLTYVPILLLGSHGYHGDLPRSLLASLSFVPYPTYGVDGSGNVYPLYSLGWTLNYEMLFYLIFSMFMWLSLRSAQLAIGATLCALVVAGLVVSPRHSELRFWTQPIILEFGLGLAVAALWLQGFRLSGRVCAVIAACALGYVAWDPLHLTIKPAGGSTPNDLIRVLAWGLPAAALVLAASFPEKNRRFAGRLVAGLSFCGDCSYALYLLHPLVLIVLGKVWLRLHVGQTLGFIPLAAAVVLTSYALAAITHLVLEKPLVRNLRRHLLRQSEPLAALPA